MAGMFAVYHGPKALNIAKQSQLNGSDFIDALNK
jgi:hypothetical protein